MQKVITERVYATITVEVEFERCSETANEGWTLVNLSTMNLDINANYDTDDVETIIGETVDE